MAKEWLFLPLFYICTRKLDVRGLSALLGLPVSAAKRIVWALSYSGYLRSHKPTLEASCDTAAWIEVVVRRNNRCVLYGDGRIVLVRIKNKRLRGYSVSLRHACQAMKTLEAKGLEPGECRRSKDCLRALADVLKTHPKTASIVLRALHMLYCPGPYCLLDCSQT